MKGTDFRKAASLGGLKLRNRMIRSGCYEGYCRNGEVTDDLIDHHRQVARGGIAMPRMLARMTASRLNCHAPGGGGLYFPMLLGKRYDV